MQVASRLINGYDWVFSFVARFKPYLILLVALLITCYLYFQHQATQAKYQTLLKAPEVDDLIIYDVGKLSDKQYQTQLRVLQITAVEEQQIEAKESAYTYSSMRKITMDIRVSMLMTDNYFKRQPKTLARQQLTSLLADEVILEVHRPVGTHALGGVVRQRFKEPEIQYHGPKIQQQNQEAIYAYSQGDFVTARDMFASIAETGHAWAQYNYATMLRDGEGGEQDLTAAVKWLKRSAAQDNPKAKVALSELCKTHKCD
ncbi:MULTISPECIES: tetratricopeptide repeat protein [unclassified Pseudoalteromonas]|uniref:tetratricopeptide repeat protein n=1 Tax=unclassified Pseudoalteromonas TaxID=194690 RepID=UPI0030148CA1